MLISSLITQADDSVLMALNTLMGQSTTFDKTLRFLLTADLAKFGVLMTTYVWLWFIDDSEQRRRREYLTVGIVSGFVGMLLARALALGLPFRERPFVRLGQEFVLPNFYEPEFRTWSAFPSDHAVLVFALCTALWLISRRLGLAAMLYSMLIILLPRIYFGLHHPSDVLAGALIGIGITLAFQRSSFCAWLNGKMVGFRHRHPGPFYASSFVVIYEISILLGGLREFAQSLFKFLRVAIDGSAD